MLVPKSVLRYIYEIMNGQEKGNLKEKSLRKITLKIVKPRTVSNIIVDKVFYYWVKIGDVS